MMEAVRAELEEVRQKIENVALVASEVIRG
jgi:hypothetical protein